MTKNFLLGLLACLILVGISSTSQATLIQSEPIQDSPSSTDNLWEYSYLAYDSSITTAYSYFISQYADAVSQGYVTGHATGYTHAVDRFLINPLSDYKTTHVFETYIMSSIDQTIRLRSGGDDGHSILVDDVFGDGRGFGSTADTNLAMLANTQYKLTLVLNNYTGPWSMWFNTTGTTEMGDAWGGAVSDAYNISMNATGDFAPVPEPATLLLFGLGLLGLAGVSRKK